MRESGTIGLEMRARELGDVEMLDSFVAELEVAAILAINGLRVEFLSSNPSNGVKPPDMIARRASRNLAVEVKMLTDNQVFHRIQKGLRKILGDTGFSARVTLGPDIAQADKFHRMKFIELMLKDVELKFNPHASQFQEVATSFGNVCLWKRPEEECEIFFGTTIIGIPRSLFRERIKSDILDAAEKRGTWDGELAGYPFLVALVAKEHWTNHNDVEHVANGAEGLFVTNEMCRNVTAVMSVAITGRVRVLPNPRAFADISEPNLAAQFKIGLDGTEP